MLLIAGTGGFSKELLHVLSSNNPELSLVFYDDVTAGLPTLLFNRFPIITTPEQAAAHFAQHSAFAIGVGKPWLRYQLASRLSGLGGKLTSVVSKHAIVGQFDNEIGTGTAIMDLAVIETSNRIGQGCLVHKSAFISHDVVVGDFCEISPAANLLGKVKMGHGCSIGTGATLLPGVTLGNNVVVGAGAVVSKAVESNSQVVGVPARMVKKLPHLDYSPLSF